jgi:hypothetical protein
VTQYLYGFEDGTDGQPYVIDTPAQGATGFSPNVASDHPAHGSLCIEVDGSGSYQYVQKNLPAAVTKLMVRGYLWSDTAMTGDANFMQMFSTITDSGSANRTLQLRRQGTNRFRIADSTGATVWTAANALSDSTYYRWELFVSCGTLGNAARRPRHRRRGD